MISIENTNCPLCRTKFSNSDILHVSSHLNKKVELNSKEVEVLNLIRSKPDAKFLIFSSYDSSFIKLCDLLKKYNINHNRLIGHQSTISKVLDNYNNDMNVLMLNASHYGCGLNLTNTTDLVFFHKMESDLKMQVIGRAQRIGRSTILNIHYMFYENEFNQDQQII